MELIKIDKFKMIQWLRHLAIEQNYKMSLQVEIIVFSGHHTFFKRPDNIVNFLYIINKAAFSSGVQHNLTRLYYKNEIFFTLPTIQSLLSQLLSPTLAALKQP